MARKKKQDFWDDIDDKEVTMVRERIEGNTVQNVGLNADQEDYEDDYEEDNGEGFKFTKCLPLKIIARLFLLLSVAVISVSGYIGYKYIQDRYAGGEYSSSYYDSKGFSEEYNKNVNQLIRLIQAVDSDTSVLDAENAEALKSLISNYMGEESNFKYIVYDDDANLIFASSEGAVEEIEASNHYLKISTKDGQWSVNKSISGSGLNETSWQAALSTCSRAFVIYTSVSNELSVQDNFYTSSQEYDKLGDYFSYAKIAGIAALVIFIICLIYCVMSTGMRRGYDSVQFTWFDRIFTELGLIIILAILGGIAYGIYYVRSNEIRFEKWISIGGALVFYIFAARGYFSLVRRIKGGTFVKNSIIYKIVHGIMGGIRKLPAAARVAIAVIVLLGVNGGLVFGILKMRDYYIGTIPAIFIIAPIVILIEFICIIRWILGLNRNDEEDEEEQSEQPVAANPSMSHVIEQKGDVDWEHIDLASSIEAATKASGDAILEPVSMESTRPGRSVSVPEPSSTVVLSREETEAVRKSAGLETSMSGGMPNAMPTSSVVNAIKTETEPVIKSVEAAMQGLAAGTGAALGAVAAAKAEPQDDSGKVDLIALNKEIRREHRNTMKDKGIGVTVKAPGNPILLDVDRSLLHKVVSNIFDNIVQYTADNTRVYIEMYVQSNKVIYVVKNTVREDALAEAEAIVKGGIGTFAGQGLLEAKQLVESQKGKFIISMDKGVFKTGMLLDIH